MLPEAIAIVMAPTDESRYAFNFLISLLDNVILQYNELLRHDYLHYWFKY